MKALSVKQPWAWLILNAGKSVENRSWKTNYRGRVYLHVGQQTDKTGFPLQRQYVKDSNIIIPDTLTTGCIVGEVDIVDCVTQSNSPWFEGAYGFVLANPIMYETPVPCKGKLGFFEVDREVKEVIWQTN